MEEILGEQIMQETQREGNVELETTLHIVIIGPAQDNPKISLHAIMGFLNPKTMQVQEWVGCPLLQF